MPRADLIAYPGSIPSLTDIDAISAIADPVIRNLRITQCYHELSEALAARLGLAANWCTFATWASKQAGQTIRKEDLKRLLEIRLSQEAAPAQAAAHLADVAELAGAQQAAALQRRALNPRNFSSAIERASEAVGRGNKKVFDEIGREFARFIGACLQDEQLDSDSMIRFCEVLRPGDPPEGQQYLRQAFSHYYAAMFDADAKARAELILLANIEIGFHEQTRLQPEIAEALDAGLISSMEFTRRLLAAIFPYKGWPALVNLGLRRLMGRPNALDRAIKGLLDTTRAFLRQTLTEFMMTLNLSRGVQLRLGEDLQVDFPPSLRQIENLELQSLLQKVDPTPNNLAGSGARDWANLPDRLHFIVDLFRCYQENEDLLDQPFTADQVTLIKAGKIPEGRL
jgi:hypothetical protein